MLSVGLFGTGGTDKGRKDGFELNAIAVEDGQLDLQRADGCEEWFPGRIGLDGSADAGGEPACRGRPDEGGHRQEARGRR